MVKPIHLSDLLSAASSRRIAARAAELAALDLDAVVERLTRELGQAGAGLVALKTYCNGPERRYFSWTADRRPRLEQAELGLLLPDGREMLLCRSTDDPACTMGALRSTAPGGEILEVVDVGSGTRASGVRSSRLAGKLALASGHNFHAALVETLVNRQAAGLLCGPGSEGADPQRPVPRWLEHPALFDKRRPFGFNLSAAQWSGLVARLAGGEQLRARVNLRTTTDSGEMPVVSALLEGSDLAGERVLLLAECRQGESCREVAVLLEVLRVLSGLVVAGTLPPLRRGLQLLIPTERTALVAWLEEQQPDLGSCRAALHLTLPRTEHLALRLHLPPARWPSFHADLVEEHLLRLERHFEGSLSLASAPYAAGSPVFPLVAEEIALPALWIAGAPVGRGGRGGEDGLRGLAAALGAALYDLCTLAEEELPRLIGGTQLAGARRLVERARRLHDGLPERLQHDDAPATVRHLCWQIEEDLQHQLEREQATLKSCGDYVGGPGQHALRLAEAAAELAQLTTSLQGALLTELLAARPLSRAAPQRQLTALERRARSVSVRRRVSGPLPLHAVLADATPTDREWLVLNTYPPGEQPFEAAVLQVSAGLTLLDIFDRLRLDYPSADLRKIWRYFEILDHVGLLQLEEIPRVTTPERHATEKGDS